MTEQAYDRAGVLLELEGGRLSVAEAASALEVSERWIRALRRRLRRRGVTGLNHGNVGRTPWHAYPDEVKDHIVALAKDPRYEGMNQHQFTEYLAEHEGILVSRPVVHRILRAAEIAAPRPKRRAKAYHGRRERSARAGHMVQMDASLHQWVPHLPKFTIVAGIDDATGYLWLFIREKEDTQGYMQVVREITTTVGVPRILYTDRHGMFGTSTQFAKERKVGMTQLQRAFRQLGIRLIRAKSPEAKGRVERVFDTLQDRLVSHFRFDQVQTMDEVERSLRTYLRNHNKRFTHPAREEKSAWRLWPTTLQPDDVFCFQYTRVVRNDNTITFFRQIIDLPPAPHNGSRAKHRVTVLQSFDGTLRVMDEGVLLTLVMPRRPPDPRTRAAVPRSTTRTRAVETTGTSATVEA
jgi:transposase